MKQLITSIPVWVEAFLMGAGAYIIESLVTYWGTDGKTGITWQGLAGAILIGLYKYQSGKIRLHQEPPTPGPHPGGAE